MQMFVNIILLISLLIFIFYLLILIVSIIGLRNHEKQEPIAVKTNNFPFVSILIAARNEEDNILKCLQSVNNLNYPHERLEVLVGNDQSTDATAAIVEAFIKEKEWFKLIQIGDEIQTTKGKARVLATLAQHAKGEYLLVTDADIELPSSWVSSLLSGFRTPKTGIVSGTTWVKYNNPIEKLQATDWIYFTGLSQGLASVGLPLTAIGNNMATLRKAYDETGGYEKLPFSITEDYLLFKEVRKLGYETVNLMEPTSLCMSEPIRGFKKLMNQRKRWLVGGLGLPFHWKFSLFIFGAWYIASYVCLFFHPFLFFSFWMVKFLFQYYQFSQISRIMKTNTIPFLHHLAYELYLMLLTPLTALYFLFPAKTVWKGRKY